MTTPTPAERIARIDARLQNAWTAGAVSGDFVATKAINLARAELALLAAELLPEASAPKATPRTYDETCQLGPDDLARIEQAMDAGDAVGLDLELAS